MDKEHSFYKYIRTRAHAHSHAYVRMCACVRVRVCVWMFISVIKYLFELDKILFATSFKICFLCHVVVIWVTRRFLFEPYLRKERLMVITKTAHLYLLLLYLWLNRNQKEVRVWIHPFDRNKGKKLLSSVRQVYLRPKFSFSSLCSNWLFGSSSVSLTPHDFQHILTPVLAAIKLCLVTYQSRLSKCPTSLLLEDV